LAVGLVFGLGAAVFFGSLDAHDLLDILVAGLNVGLVCGLFSGMLGALVFGAQSCLSHLALRLVVWWHNLAPWKYAQFLDTAVDRIFLRNVGGGYIFVHRLLLEYFAELGDTE
jgi:hypothetical protein